MLSGFGEEQKSGGAIGQNFRAWPVHAFSTRKGVRIQSRSGRRAGTGLANREPEKSFLQYYRFSLYGEFRQRAEPLVLFLGRYLV